MAQKFKAGDVVRLRSGGPQMTVVKSDKYNNSDGYLCRWFEKGTVMQHVFGEAELELADVLTAAEILRS